MSFRFGLRPPERDLHPSVIQMSGGSTRKGYATSVRRQSRQRLCGEFRLRRGFACGKTLVRRIGAAGQKAGWVVLLYLFEISCGRNVRFAAHVFLYLWQKRSHPPDPCAPSPTATRPEGGFYDREAIDFDRFSNAARIPCFPAGFCDILDIMTKGAAYGH